MRKNSSTATSTATAASTTETRGDGGPERLPVVGVHNADIAAIFEEIADLLEIEGANPFRVRAYRNAAREMQSLGTPVTSPVRASR